MPDAEDQPRPSDEGEGCDATRRGGAKRTSVELEAIVLSILRTSPRPLGAYVIARESRSLGIALAPNQVYRILDRLGGRVRRVEMLNAYFEDASHAAAITICRACGAARALPFEPGDAIERLARKAGFRPSRTIIEIPGRCPDCARPRNLLDGGG